MAQDLPRPEGGVRPALQDFCRDAAPLTAAALVMLVELYLVVPGAAEGTPALLALYLVLIFALTLPHAAVVLWTARRGCSRTSDPMRDGIVAIPPELPDDDGEDAARAAPAISANTTLLSSGS